MSKQNSDFVEASKALEEGFEAFELVALEIFVPMFGLTKLLTGNAIENTFTHLENIFRKYVKNAIVDFKNRKKNKNVTANNAEIDKCYFDVLYDKLINNDENKDITQEMLIADVIEMLQAGMDTTETTFEIALYSLAQNADMQEQIYKELKKNALVALDSSVSKNCKRVSFNIKNVKHCIKFRAFLNEILRMTAIVTDPHELPTKCKLCFDS